MRRKEREITDFTEKIDILKRCDTIRLGLSNGAAPYVVPVSFGMQVDNGVIVIYFHSAQKGQKSELLSAHPNVCIEADIFEKVEETEQGITTRYESVIGTGIAELVPDEEKALGLAAILEHYGYCDYPIGRCKGIAVTAVYKITVRELTGKRNLRQC